MTTAIKGEQKRIIDIFSKDYLFTIPPYQRPYSWSADEVEQLIDDISYFAFKDGKVENINPYFLGSLVLITGDEVPSSDVIDGQQRLTTLTILLSVAREILNDKELNDYLIEKGNKWSGTKETHRLSIRERDKGIMEKYIYASGMLKDLQDLKEISDSQKNIRDNALCIKKQFESKGFSHEKLGRFVQYLLKRCYLIVVSTADQESAYRIFSVMNDRGMQLSHADILKSEIVGEITSDKQESYTTKWEDIEERLGFEEFKNLFSYIRMIFIRKKQRDTILKEIRDNIKPADNPVDFIENTLEPLAKAYEDVVKCAFEASSNADKINRILKWLNMIDNTDWIPPALFFISKNRNNTDNILSFLERLERLASGMMIYRADINTRIEKYAKILDEISDGKDFSHTDSEIYLSDEEKRLIITTLHGDVYLIRKIRKYCLLKIDAELSTGAATYDYPIITIEHVLPQNPKHGSGWNKNFSTKEIREKYVHKLGNLLLLAKRKNSEAQNFDFDIKKEKYFKSDKGSSPFAITTQVLDKTEWTEEVIKERQTELINVCRKIWNFDGRIRLNPPSGSE